MERVPAGSDDELMAVLGYDSVGSSSTTVSYDEHLMCQFTASATSIIRQLSIYIINAVPGEFLRLTIYSDDSDSPLSYMGQTVEITMASDGWYTALLQCPLVITSGTIYWLGVISNSEFDVAYESTASDPVVGWELAFVSYGQPDNPWTEAADSSGSGKYSIYAYNVTLPVPWIGYKDPKYGFYSGDGPGADYMVLIKVLAIENITIATVGAHLDSGFTGGEYARAVIYSDDGANTPTDLLGQSDPIEGVDTDMLYEFTLQSTVDFVSGEYYWIGIHTPQNTYYMSYTFPVLTVASDYRYGIIDTYADGPADPCNAPDTFGATQLGFYAAGTASVGEISNNSAGIILTIL